MVLSREELADRRSEARLTDYLTWNVLLGGISVVATAMLLLIHRSIGAAVAAELHVPDGQRYWYGLGLLLLGAPTIFFAIARLLSR